MAIRFSVRAQKEPSSKEATAVYEFDQDKVIVGRAATSDVQLPQRSVSHMHAVIQHQAGRYVIQDQGSTNGTLINGAALVPHRAKALKNGDVIEIGPFVIQFECGVAIREQTSAERTAALARQLIRDALEGDAPIARPRLAIVQGPQTGTFVEIEPFANRGRVLIGRGEKCNLMLNDADASREHAEMIWDSDGPLLRDLGSKNGIQVDDRRLTELRVRNGDELQIGSTWLAFEDPADAAVRTIESEPEDDVADSESIFSEQPKSRVLKASLTSNQSARASQTVTSTAPKKSPFDFIWKRVRHAGADLIIYALAAIVFAASLTGLILLLSSH